jgi:cyanophycinase
MKKKSTQKKEGTLVVIGGHEDKEGECVILKEIVKRVGSGKLVIATVATRAPDEYFESYHKIFKKLGIKNLMKLHLEDRAESFDEEKLKVLDKASGIFFTGGDQLRISSQIGDTLFEEYVKDIYHRGGIIAGTSAGASAMGETMLVKGSNSESHKIGDLHLAPGLGLIPDVIIDQHFAERGRIGRLLGSIAINPRILGIGIDEDTAIVRHDGHFSVIGSGAVYVVDGCGVTHSNIAEAEPESILSMFDVTLHILSSGDNFDLLNRKPIIPEHARASLGKARSRLLH